MESSRLLMILFEAAFGGVERQAELLCQAAHAEGCQTTIWILGPEGPALPRFRAACDDVQVLNLDLHKDREISGRLADLVRGRVWDGAIIFSTAKVAVVSHAIRHSAASQAVYVGNPVPPDWWTYLKHRFRSWRYPCAERLIFLGCSAYVLESLRSNGFFNRFRCGVSWNCVQIPTEPASIRSECVPLHFGMVARLDRIKDQETLIRAAALLRDEGIPAVLHLIGAGEKEHRLRQVARELGFPLSDEGHEQRTAVRFEGTSDDVFSAMRKWDLFTFSTTKEEGFGAAAAEAMALGLPCIFTDVGPCREVGGQAVRYVPEKSPRAWADALKSLSADLAERRRLAVAARERAAQWFTKERMWREYRQALGLPEPVP